MIDVQTIFQKQFIQLAVLMVIGVGMGLIERRYAVRDTSGYRDHRTEAVAIAVIFFESAGFVALTAFLCSLEIFRPLQRSVNALPWYVLVIGTSLISDFINYFAHRILHYEHFWRFHKFHHSPSELFWLTGFRGSLVHNLLLGAKNIVLLTVSNLNPVVLATLAIQGLYAQMAGHVNFDIRIPFISRILVTPQYHRIHHAVDRKLHDSNYGFVWTFWDKIFGTQTPPETTNKDFKIGIAETEKVSLIRMILG